MLCVIHAITQSLFFIPLRFLTPYGIAAAIVVNVLTSAFMFYGIFRDNWRFLAAYLFGLVRPFTVSQRQMVASLIAMLFFVLTMYMIFHQDTGVGCWMSRRNYIVKERCQSLIFLWLVLLANKTLLCLYTIVYWILEVLPLLGYTKFFLVYINCLRKVPSV